MFARPRSYCQFGGPSNFTSWASVQYRKCPTEFMTMGYDGVDHVLGQHGWKRPISTVKSSFIQCAHSLQPKHRVPSTLRLRPPSAAARFSRRWSSTRSPRSVMAAVPSSCETQVVQSLLEVRETARRARDLRPGEVCKPRFKAICGKCDADPSLDLFPRYWKGASQFGSFPQLWELGVRRHRAFHAQSKRLVPAQTYEL